MIAWKLITSRAGLAISACALILVYHFWTLHRAAEGARDIVQAKWDESVRLQHEQTQRDHEHAVITYKLETSSTPLPAPVIRLCPPSPVVEGAVAEGTGDTGTDAPVLPDLPAGTDVGPALDRLMQEADEVSARLRAIQSLF